ncbi:hypothetical protein ACHAXS_003686 [Conticribra weissflogii]
MSSSSPNGEANSAEGRIWIHSPLELIPCSSSITSIPKVSIVRCPLPKKTPYSPPQDRLHNLAPPYFSLHPCTQGDDNPLQIFLNKIRQSKLDMYRSQYREKVLATEDESRIETRRIFGCSSGSGRDVHEVEVTIYHPPLKKNNHRIINDEIDENSRAGIESENNDDTSKNNTSKILETLPSIPRGICLHVHGGGWLWGDSRYQVAHRCLEMARVLNVVVVSVEYSLLAGREEGLEQQQCKEDGFLFDPLQEVITAMEWIESCASEEFLCPSDKSMSNFIASGESSGAHLLMLAMLHRRDRVLTNARKEKQDLITTIEPRYQNDSKKRIKENKQLSSIWKCMNLVYGVFDLSGTPSVRADGVASMPLCGKDLLWMYRLYCANINARRQEKSEDAKHDACYTMNPSNSPLYANLCNMPPALFTIGTSDPLIDDTMFMASRYSLCGSRVEMAIYEGGEHGIGHFGVQEDEEMGKRAREYTLEFMGRHLGESG